MDTLSKIKVLHGTTDLNKEPLTSVETFHGTKGSLQWKKKASLDY